MVLWCSSESEPTIASIFQVHHAQRPIRGLPGGALCFPRVVAGAVGRLGCGCLVPAAGRASRSAGSAFELGHVADRHCCVLRMGLRSCLELATGAGGRACLGHGASARRGRRPTWRMALAKQEPRPGRAFARIAPSSGFSGSRVAPCEVGQRERPLDLGREPPRTFALERPAPGIGIERHLTLPFLPRVIFPRA